MSIGFYSLEDAIERTGKSKGELLEMVKSGRLNTVEDGDALWFSAADVDGVSEAPIKLAPSESNEKVRPEKAEKNREKKKSRRDAEKPEVKVMSDAEWMIQAAEPDKDGEPDLADVPITLDDDEQLDKPPEDGMSKIKAFGGGGIQAAQSSLKTATLKRELVTSGQGATRCRTFHSKLNDGSLANMNNNMNDWIDENPDIEIKFASTCVGVVEGKHADMHLIITVFY